MAHPKVLTVGENTAGKKHFCNVLPLILPSSGINIAMASHYWQYPNHSFIEKSGHAPMIHLTAGQNAMEYAMRNK